MSETQILSGKWKVGKDDIAYDGNLIFNEEDRYVTLEILIPEASDNTAVRFPYSGKLSFISGTLLTGATVLLYDGEIGPTNYRVMQYTRILIYVKYAFWGLSEKNLDDFAFRGASVDFGDILNWYDICKYEKTRSDKKTIGYVWKNDDIIDVKVSDTLSLKFNPTTSGYWGKIYKQEIKLNQTVWIQFEYKTDVNWESILQDVQKIQYLIGLGTKQRIEISEIKYIHHSMYTILSEESGNRIWNEGDVLLGTGKVERTRYTEPRDFAFNLKDFLKVKKGVTNWFLHYDKLKPVLDLFFSIYGPAYSVETAFLNLSQALETYHARFKANTIGEYKKRVKNLVTNSAGSENKNYWSWFLLDDGQQKSKQIKLRSRLADLYYADGQLPLMRECDLPSDIVQKICDSRNYYTHYEEKKRSLAYTCEELPIVNGYLICLLRYHIMCLIGFDPDDAKNAIKDRVDWLYNYLKKNNLHLYNYPEN